MNNILIRFLLLIFTASVSYVGIAQDEIQLDLKWNDTLAKMTIGSQIVEYPNLKSSFVSENEFLFIHKFKRANSNTAHDFSLVSYQTSQLTNKEKLFLHNANIEVSSAPIIRVKNNSDFKNYYANVSFVPFVNVNGVIQKITSITLKQISAPIYETKSASFASASVLKNGSGEWYKIKVKTNGIYKIDYDFLKNIGVNVDQLNPDHLNIYGNGFGKLPESNAEYRPDDLLKNDISVVDGGDGSFDAGDYLLFYGRGPHKWEAKNNRFQRLLNIYANYSVYYININSNSIPARISNAVMSSNTPTHVVTDYNSFAIHEKELVNLMKTGQRWYGEKFDANLTQNFSIQIPHLNPNKPASLRAYMAAKNGGGTTGFRVQYNSTTIGSASIGASNDDSFSRAGFLTSPSGFNPSSSNFSLRVNFTRSNPSDEGYLDFLEVNARSYLTYFDGMSFRDLESVGVGNIAEMQISSFPSNGKVWEVTQPNTPKLVTGSASGGTYNFSFAADSLRTFVAFASQFNSPEYIGKVAHQNLHGLPAADYLIVTHPNFLSQANRLATLHEGKGLSVHVVTTTQVYNEFSGGTQDPTAIKYFAKMFYDRAGADVSLRPKYLLLFGDGTYDPLSRIANNNYMVPVYETLNSENYTSAIVSDDYFGFLDDSEEFSPSDLLDIAVGRLVATSKSDAITLVNKIEHYMKNGSMLYSSNNLLCGEDGYISTHGDWRLKYTLIADDEESGYFINQDLEPASIYVDANHPEMNVKKIYADAYPQITTAGGERYPEVNNEINRSIESGSLVTCYVGHGNSESAAQERIMSIGSVQEYENIDKLTLFVSATCEFARIDDNELVSIGEWMALNEVGGAIALMTTTRAVYFSTNSVTTKQFFENVFTRDASGKPLTFGEIILRTKNGVTGSSNNKRSFMLLGDPALEIALPYENIVLDSINSLDVNLVTDTIRALSKVNMKGHVEDQYGNLLTGFNGFVQPSVYDKPASRATLGQDALSPVIPFSQQDNILFKGKSSVQNGRFEFDFIVPKDIDYNYGKGKASFYSWSKNNNNGGGYSTDFLIGGIDTTGLNDQVGPEIEIYLNDDSFVSGGITNESPVLIANLFDESGINTVGNGIGHDITMILDAKTSEAKVLNEFYESDLDTYKSGSLRYQIGDLSPGLHTLTFKAWDVNNNSSEKTIEFTVHEDEDIALDHVLNYPNPFTTHTEFFFEHNQVCAALETQIEIYTVTGRLIKTINRTVETRGFRTEGIPWDGRDEFGDQLAKGIYVYRVTVKSPEGEKAQEMQKLYLLK
ncbi:hypothetical protein CW751_07835 [Brumimicrobium salinarum]|uniref:Gingipain domain-containing protein n=1 Tax=Brumimicrobium salinarum TaxID=2058658 RepID=A0A2I0R261_9FLAO|nr:type IX secretion system sortase PorU [Brumimicrobium salinarum]PKR80671.1 hypothetical protein CW751_07835 [Brumimicrobium salinarum]